MPAVGETIDRYVIEAVLGEGGMGRVYRAHDPRLGRRVALKVLLAEGADDGARAEAAARMAREARAAAAFNHPNVVAVYDVGEVGGNPFITMELVNGAPMRKAFADPTVSLGQRVAWLLEIARGLGAAHKAGLVHRDVKPDNVMLTADGVVKILDFGVARRSEIEAVDPTAPTSGANLATLTARGVAVGTPQYMSPEQLHGEPLDGRTDQFAWGVVAWELLAGASPWGTKAGAQLITAVLAAPVRSLAEVVPGLEPRIAEAIGRALEKNRDRRFATMDELVAFIEGENVRPPSPGSSARLPVLRGPDTGPTFAQKTRSVPSHPTSPSHRRAIAFVGVAAAVAAVVSWVALGRNERPVVANAPASVDAAGSAPAAHKVPPEVEAFFARAAQDEKDGRHDLACAEYVHAVDAVPSSGEAALAVAVCHRNDPPGGRAFFHRAWAQRAALSPRDAAVLDAFEPLFQRDPADIGEEKRRLEAAAARYPDDAEIAFLLAGSYRRDHDDIRRAVGEIERSLALSPLPYVLSIKSDFHGYDGDFKAAHAAIERCLQLAPGALDCLEEEEWIDSDEGECGKMETAARRMLAIDASYPIAVHSLANALYARGGSIETSRELLRRTREADASVAEARPDEAHMAVLAGDFVTAEKLARAMAADAQASPSAADHGVVAKVLLDIYEETGRDAEASNVARAYLAGRDAWETNPNFDDWAMRDEPTPAMLLARRRAGALSREAYAQEIAKTVRRWGERATPATHDFVWFYAYATVAETPDDARVAMDALPKYQPLPKFKPLSLVDEGIGRAYLLAGRTDDALGALDRATRSCYPLEHPFEHTRAYYELGLAREAKGDAAGACEAYRVVRERWGDAKPKSVTAQRAGSRAASIKCPR